MKLTTANRFPRNHLESFETKRDDEYRCYTFCTMSLLFQIGALVMATQQPSSTNAHLQLQDGNVGADCPDRQGIKQVCHAQGPSDVLVGDSAALDGPFKLCGSDLKPENQRKVGETRRAVVMKQRRNTGTDEGKF